MHCGRVSPKSLRKLVWCDGVSQPCYLPICAVCARQYRIDALPAAPRARRLL